MSPGKAAGVALAVSVVIGAIGALLTKSPYYAVAVVIGSLLFALISPSSFTSAKSLAIRVAVNCLVLLLLLIGNRYFLK